MQNTQEKRPEIRKIMEKETAIKTLNEIKDLIGGVDLTSICDDELEIKPENIQDPIQKMLVAAVQCGLVYWDEQENCLIQKLIRPLKAGELTASEFKYKNRLNVKELKSINAMSELDLFEKVLSQIVARPSHLVGQLMGQDIDISMGCLCFFGK